MRLVHAGRMICKVKRDFKIITAVLSRVSLVTSNIRGSSICSPKSLCKKTSNKIFGRVEGSCQNGCVKGSEVPTCPTPVGYDLSVRRVSNSQLSPTPRHQREEGRRWTQLKWIKNIFKNFFPYLRVWVFLFLWTSFFTAQNVDPMVHLDFIKNSYKA